MIFYIISFSGIKFNSIEPNANIKYEGDDVSHAIISFNPENVEKPRIT